MPLWTDATISRWYLDGEQDLSTTQPWLVDRFSPSIVAGTAAYVLPNSVKAIRRVTWLGYKLDPMPRRDHKEAFQSATQQGRPFWYVFNNVGLNTISLFPVPQSTLASGSNLWTTDISTSCIVEFDRVADGNTFIVPTYFRAQVLKYYVGMMVYKMEGSGQNLKLAKYFEKRWTDEQASFFAFCKEVKGKPRKLVTQNITASNFFPAYPVLPIDRYGTSVDDGM
jgi:hypothetical protein